MRTIRIFSTKEDQYLDRFRQEAKDLGIKIKIYHYERFSFVDNKLTYTGRKDFPEFTENDVVLFRRCAYEKKRQHFWLRLLATLARDAGARVLNEDFMVNFPLHSGKLFQAAYFASKKIPHISTYRLRSKLKLDEKDYPFLIKKRYTAFGKDSYLLKKPEDLLRVKNSLKRLDDFVIQPFLELERDLRVMILDGKIIGAINRKVKIGEDGQVTVKVDKKVEMTSKEKEIVERVLECFDLDMAGLDLFTSKTCKLWLGEINFFPNFTGFMKLSGDNIFKDILKLMSIE